MMQQDTRTERDFIGEKEIPAQAYYGIHSLRATENFCITGTRLHPDMICSLAMVKKACAIANGQAGVLDSDRADAIAQACDLILKGQFHDQFIVDPIQGGAGTSMNMNANEVIANIAIELLGGKKGNYSIISPTDHVNCGQSTNDVIPTAGKIATLVMLRELEASLEALQKALDEKAQEFDPILKMGRTQLQDAVPVRLGQEFHAYATSVARGLARVRHSGHELLSINLGGTAIGTGINADEAYFCHIIEILSSYMGQEFHRAEDLIDSTQNVDCFAAVSSAVRNCALALSKIANDLRLMSSGPRAGFGEISLPARQNGSSIMPGKVNPVIPEAVNQVAFRIVGNDVTISMAVEAGQMELNAFEPVILHCLFESISNLTHSVNSFTTNCVQGIKANKDRCAELLDSSVGVVTALCPYIGYTKAAALAKEALKHDVTVRQLILSKALMSEAEVDRILDLNNMTRPGISGKLFPVKK